MMNKVIIGLGYKMGVGKDTVADNLAFMAGFVKYRFADALKAAACCIFGWRREQLEDLNFKMAVDPYWGKTPRELLQLLGTECGRGIIDPLIWIKALKRRIDLSESPRIVISDMRFNNELEAVKSWGGHVVKVLRHDYVPEGLSEAQRTHPSETELDGYDSWDYILRNDTGLTALSDRTAEMWNKLSSLKSA